MAQLGPDSDFLDTGSQKTAPIRESDKTEMGTQREKKKIDTERWRHTHTYTWLAEIKMGRDKKEIFPNLPFLPVR